MKKRIVRTCLIILCIYVCAGHTAPLRIRQIQAEEVCAAQAACVMEQTSRRVLYEYRGDVRLPMASTTKIATAITVLENCADIEKRVTIPQEAVGIEGSSVYLQCGEEYSVEDLLYGLMLRSGNDCAAALALHCGDTQANFATLMNKTAQRAGALNTNFINPHGLPAPNHYTTARDLSYITCYAMENPIFQKIVATRYYEPRGWKNKNKLLTNYEAAIGVKTGYTKEAGRCLVSAAKQGEMVLVCTVLNCADMYEASKKLLEDAFSCYKYAKLLDKTETFTITNGKQSYEGKAMEDCFYPLLPEEQELVEREIILNKSQVKMDENGEILGQMEIRLANHLLFSVNLYKL